jgi:hypothetical protein
MMKVRAFISYVVLIALVTTWSTGFGGVLYQACPADCCSSVKEPSPCAHGLGDQSNAISDASITGDRAVDACSCNSTCDNTCSECVYFHAGVVQNPIWSAASLPVIPFSSPNLSLQDYSFQDFHPPRASLA